MRSTTYDLNLFVWVACFNESGDKTSSVAAELIERVDRLEREGAELKAQLGMQSKWQAD